MKHEAPISYLIEEGKSYQPIGGDQEDLETNCPKCGGSYAGHQQQVCPRCGGLRKVFLVEQTEPVLDLSIPLDPDSPNILPQKHLTPSVTIGERSRRNTIEAIMVFLGTYSYAKIILADKVSAESFTTADTVLARELITTDYEFKSNRVVTADAKLNGGNRIGELFILPGGQAIIGRDAIIGQLIVGHGATRLELGAGSTIQTLITTPDAAEMSNGDNCRVDAEKKISSMEYAQRLNDLLDEIRRTGDIS